MICLLGDHNSPHLFLSTSSVIAQTASSFALPDAGAAYPLPAQRPRRITTGLYPRRFGFSDYEKDSYAGRGQYRWKSGASEKKSLRLSTPTHRGHDQLKNPQNVCHSVTNVKPTKTAAIDQLTSFRRARFCALPSILCRLSLRQEDQERRHHDTADDLGHYGDEV